MSRQDPEHYQIQIEEGGKIINSSTGDSVEFDDLPLYVQATLKAYTISLQVQAQENTDVNEESTD